MWEGRTVAILASGPSMSAHVAENIRQAGIPAVAINDTARLAPWADMLYACDGKWWLHHASWALNFAGLKVTADDSLVFPQVKCIGLRPNGRGGYEELGFDPDPAYVRTGENSGYQTTHIVAHGGAKRILLTGFDMRGDHWFGKHPPGLADANGCGVFPQFIENFKTIVEPLRERGIDVVNCTPDSALRCFPLGNLEDELSRATSGNSSAAR